MALIIIQQDDIGLEGFDGMILYLEALEDRMPKAFMDAADRTSLAVELRAINTTSYEDDTGATRASTVAFAAGLGIPNEEIPMKSIADANALRANSADDDSIPPAPGEDEIITYVMSATNYSKHLNERNGGESMYLELAVLDNVELIAREHQKVFARYFRP